MSTPAGIVLFFTLFVGVAVFIFVASGR